MEFTLENAGHVWPMWFMSLVLISQVGLGLYRWRGHRGGNSIDGKLDGIIVTQAVHGEKLLTLEAHSQHNAECVDELKKETAFLSGRLSNFPGTLT